MASAPTPRALAIVTVLLCAGSAMAADPLVQAEATPRPNGLPSERVLTVDRDALAALRTRTTATLEGFPLGGDGPATLDLTRIRPFDEHTRIEEVTDAGVRAVALPDETYFSGTVRGAARSRVLLIATDDGVRGFVVRDGTTYPFGRDGLGTHRVYALRDVDPATHPGPSEFCGNDLHPDAMSSVPVPRSMPAPAAIVGPDTVLEVQVAVDTDNELRGKFADTNAATSYLTALLAAASVIYERDVKVRLTFGYVRLWSTTDPWAATDTLDALNEVQAYWLDVANGMDAKAGPHDIVHFVSGKSVSGGIAYLEAACDHTYGFGVSQVYGGFDVSNPNAIWDVLVVTHEIGHNLGSPHTHCYDPPVDRCYDAEPGCYSGAVSLPPGGGTIMSYCHLLAGGLSNVSLLFGATVSSTIRSFVTGAPCLSVAAICGDGALDAGEQCDDGNTVSGDGCASDCLHEALCGDGTVDGGEQCDDGNTTGSDGCSATCVIEPCKILTPHQTAWAPAKMVATPGTFALHGRFGVQSDVLDLQGIADGGIHLMVDGGSGARAMDVIVPGGSGWTVGATRVRYRDPGGSASGIRSLVIRTHGSGVSTVDLKITSRRGAVADPNDVPPVVTVILGDASDGEIGACGRYAFSGGECVKRGKKLTCR